jgi:hypothetical protein
MRRTPACAVRPAGSPVGLMCSRAIRSRLRFRRPWFKQPPKGYPATSYEFAQKPREQ